MFAVAHSWPLQVETVDADGQLAQLLDVRDGEGRTVLHLSATRGDSLLCKKLLTVGRAHPPLSPTLHSCPVAICCSRSSVRQVEGAVNALDNNKYTPIMEVRCSRHYILSRVVHFISIIVMQAAQYGRSLVVREMVLAGCVSSSHSVWQQPATVPTS